MKVRIFVEGAYPVYWATPDDPKWPNPYSPALAEISQETWDRWSRVTDEYTAIQQEMDDALAEAERDD